MNFLKHIFTDATNTDWDYTKVLCGIGFAAYLGMSVWIYVIQKHEWDPMLWASALIVLVGGAGSVSKIKDFTSSTKDQDAK